MPRSLATPADPRQPHLLRLLCIGFCIFDSIAVCFVGLDEAVSSFRECGLSYGLCDALCTLQSFRSMMTHLLNDCNTRYEWLVRPCSIGTCTQSETPSFAWHTEDCPRGENYSWRFFWGEVDMRLKRLIRTLF